MRKISQRKFQSKNWCLIQYNKWTDSNIINELIELSVLKNKDTCHMKSLRW
jgi:hypothetical protein